MRMECRILGLYVLAVVTLFRSVDAQLFGIRHCKDNIVTKYGFDKNQYLGKWYEIKRYYPIFFEFGLKCGVAEYALNDDGNIQVKNSGTQRLTGERNEPTVGVARILNETAEEASRLYVSFGDENNPVFNILDRSAERKGNYFVMDTDYTSFSIVYSCVNFNGIGRTEILWILGRRPELDQDTMDYIYDLLEHNNIKTKHLYPVEQNCGV